MRILLLAVFVVVVLLAFPGTDLLGAAPKNSQGKNSQGKNSKGKNSQHQRDKTGRATGQATANNQLVARQLAYRIAFSKMPRGARVAKTDFKSGSAPKGSFTESCSLNWILGQQELKSLDQQQKHAAEQKRKQAEAEAARRKKLQADKKRRNELRFTDLKKELSESASKFGQLEKQFASNRNRRKELSAAIDLTITKGTGENAPGVMARLARMKQEVKAHEERSPGLASDLSKAKSACAKWQGSSGKQAAPAASALTELEEQIFQIARDRSRVEFELKKAEAHCKDSTKALFFCVSELVRAGVAFSSQEQASIRALFK